MVRVTISIAFAALAALLFIAPGGSRAQILGLSTDPNLIAFYLYPNPANTSDFDTLVYNNTNSVVQSRYDPQKRLIMYASGFMQNHTTDDAIKDAYLQAGFAAHANIIVTDWGYLSGNKATFLGIPGLELATSLLVTILYPVVKLNVPIVGKRAFDFINFLETAGLLPLGPSNVHLVGQSFGAHVMGIAGSSYLAARGQTIGRITGTEAAGPLFQGAGVAQRLDASDAAFVDSVHCDEGGYGYKGAYATADFMINGGKAPQPGCSASGTSFADTFCSHNSAVKYFAKTIVNLGIFWGINVADGGASMIPFGERCPVTARGVYNVTMTPD